MYTLFPTHLCTYIHISMYMSLCTYIHICIYIYIHVDRIVPFARACGAKGTSPGRERAARAPAGAVDMSRFAILGAVYLVSG